MRLVANNANVPVYCSWGFQIDTGVMGGNVLDGYEQGKISAEVARKLLNDDSAEDIPPIQQAPLVCKFDYFVLNRFGINLSRIPQDCTVYNKPASFYRDNERIIWVVLATIFALVLFIMFLSINIRRRKKAERDLQKAHDELEQKIAERTIALKAANALLKEEIVKQQKTERELLSRENFFNSVFEQSPFASWISDEKGTVQRTNTALKRFLNLTDKQIVGKYNVLDDPIVERQGLLPLFRTVFDDNKSITFSFEWDGNDIPTLDLKGSRSVIVDGTMFPIHNPDGKLTNVVLQWIDITARKQAEKKLEAYNRHLENKDRAQALEIRNIKAASAQQQSELAHISRVAALNELTGSIAHELNQPLAAILCNAQAAQRFMNADPPDLDEVGGAIADIVADERRADLVIKRLRKLLKRDTSEQLLLNVNDLVHEVLAVTTNEAINANVTIALDAARVSPMIEGDRIQIEQVLINLIINGIDALRDEPTSERRVMITTSCSNKTVKIDISDTGPGLSETLKESLFQPFVTTKEKGLGIGLSICRTIVEAHKGSIIGKNQSEGGALFRVTFPAAKENDSI
ncbi:MAG: PAS domain S-box protein [Deltaproteobacteria bacterium]|nr:PAS domain S-box protein [Deltaproteobacteria bacterium]